MVWKTDTVSKKLSLAQMQLAKSTLALLSMCGHGSGLDLSKLCKDDC